MQTRPPPLSPAPHQTGAQPCAVAAKADPSVLDSATLLQGATHVRIRHEGVLYRLQVTRLGKLILTK